MAVSGPAADPPWVGGEIEGVPMQEIFKGIMPFWAAMLVCTALLILFPEIALLLPESMIPGR